MKKALIAISNDVPNHYVLSFRPSSLTEGIHALQVRILNHPHVVVKFRTEYWIDSETAR